MKQYHEHLKEVLAKGNKKAPAREGMPGSISLFGYQNRYDLSEGFPILTTKKINFKNIVVELLWFLSGQTNIKYLVDNGCNIWNEDAYNYYQKRCKEQGLIDKLSFEEFVNAIKDPDNGYQTSRNLPDNYTLGDCGKQYGWLWRNWAYDPFAVTEGDSMSWSGKRSFKEIRWNHLDQISNLIEGLKSNPEGRRHIITAWNPATLDDMALNACHSFVQFNCRRLTLEERWKISEYKYPFAEHDTLTAWGIPKFYLDCQLYQRSADMFLGVPYNISSYALLTHIIAKICNMIPGEFIHTFGDSHIYDNHMEQVNEILSRDTERYELPKLKTSIGADSLFQDLEDKLITLDDLFNQLDPLSFQLEGYESYPHIPAPLSTGLKK